MTRIYGHFVSNIWIVWSTNIHRKLRPTVYLLPFTQLGFGCFNSPFLPWRRALSYQNVIQSCLLSFQQATANKENSIVFFLTLSRNALRIYCHSQIRFMVDRSTILLLLTFPEKIRVRSFKYIFSLLYVNIYIFLFPFCFDNFHGFIDNITVESPKYQIYTHISFSVLIRSQAGESQQTFRLTGESEWVAQ